MRKQRHREIKSMALMYPARLELGFEPRQF